MTAMLLGIINAILVMILGFFPIIPITLGAVLAFVGFNVLVRRGRINSRVRKAALISSMTLLIILVISVWHVNTFLGTLERVEEMEEDMQDMNTSNWEVKKQNATRFMNEVPDDFKMIVLMIPIGSLMMTTAYVMPALAGIGSRKWIMLFPIILSLCGVMVTYHLTEEAFEDMDAILVDVENAEDYEDFKIVSASVRKIDVDDFLRGSRFGASFSMEGFFFAALLSFYVKLDREISLEEYKDKRGRDDRPKMPPGPRKPSYRRVYREREPF